MNSTFSASILATTGSSPATAALFVWFSGLFSSICLVCLLQESCRPGSQHYCSGWQGPAPGNQSDAAVLETEAEDVYYWLLTGSINMSLGAHLSPRAGHLPRKDAERRRCGQIKRWKGFNKNDTFVTGSCTNKCRYEIVSISWAYISAKLSLNA